MSAVPVAMLALLVAVSPAVAQSMETVGSVSSDLVMSRGLLVWRPAPTGGLGPSISVPQLKVFDAQGRLVFHGNAAAARAWLASPATADPTIAAQVQVRDLATERRLLKLPPVTGVPMALLYISEPCPPCADLWAGLKGPLQARMGPKGRVQVLRVGDALSLSK